MMADSSYKTGPLESRYIISKADGTPVPEGRQFFVLRLDGSDPHALVALAAYANSVEEENPTLADDLRCHLRGLTQ